MNLLITFNWYTDEDYYIDIDYLIKGLRLYNEVVYSIEPNEGAVNTSSFLVKGDRARDIAATVLETIALSVRGSAIRIFVINDLFSMLQKAAKEIRQSTTNSVFVNKSISSNYEGTELAVATLSDYDAKIVAKVLAKDSATMPVSRRKALKPLPCDIDMSRRNTANLPKPGGFAIKYCCPNCRTVFSDFISHSELNYCYKCGQAVSWRGCISYLNSRQSDLLLALGAISKDNNYLAFKAGLLKGIADANNSNDSDCEVFIGEEDE